jgi:hypothetical protein
VALAALPLALNGLAYLSLSCFATSSLGAARFYPNIWPDVPIAHDVKELANDPQDLFQTVTSLQPDIPASLSQSLASNEEKEDPRHIYLHISQIIARKRPALSFSKCFWASFPWT